MHTPTRRTPTERDAQAIVELALKQPALTIQRFPTGLCHYVYDVLLADQRRVVVRIAGAETQPQLFGGVAWSAVLRPLGVPLPQILHAEPMADTLPCPFVILERLPGVDLQEVYPSLARTDKAAIAAAVVAAQTRVGALPPGRGFGYAFDPHAAPPHRAWADVMQALLERSRRRIERAGVADSALITRVQQRATRYESYLGRIGPRAFLDDTTTKNVLIERRRMSGIVDVDAVCYGDPLWTIGLTRMALLQRAWDTDYIDIWADLLDLSAEQRRVIGFYTAVFCIDFLSEQGQVFNKRAAEPVDQARSELLLSILERTLTSC